jgi:drug/metabolite transporter (DMT)-like permease
VNLSAFTERSPITVLLLSIITCGIYFIVWKYQTTDELRRASGDESLNPTTDLLLGFVTCGLWTLYASYRNAGKIYQLSQRLGMGRSDHATAVLLLGIFGLAAVNIFILQGEYNAMSQAGRARLPG